MQTDCSENATTLNRFSGSWLRPALGELLIALALSFAFLALGIWQRLVSMSGLTTDWRALSELLGLRLGGTPLGIAVLRYVLALCALHALLALIVWFAAILTRHSFSVSSQTAALAGTRTWFLVAVIWLLVVNSTLFPSSNSGLPSELFAASLLGGARVFELLRCSCCQAR